MALLRFNISFFLLFAFTVYVESASRRNRQFHLSESKISDEETKGLNGDFASHSSYNDNDNIATESVNDAFLSKKKKGPQTKSVSGTKCKWQYTCVTYYGRRYCYWKKVCTSSGWLVDWLSVYYRQSYGILGGRKAIEYLLFGRWALRCLRDGSKFIRYPGQGGKDFFFN